jgi:hypothetical protein
MDGWQRSDDQRFDDYVDQKRLKDRFDSFDQRVERAYRVSAKLHKQEIINGFKRKLVSSSGKFSPSVMREMQSAIEERAEWLRDVFTQIDADYRSGDTERQKRAASEISDAIKGNPSDFMAYVYEQKRARRFAGEKTAAVMDAEHEDANMPSVSDEETNRYHALKTNMLELERNVKSKFGLAGQRHWAELQREKDAEYDQKLDAAVEKYKELIKQDERYETMRSTFNSRNALERRYLAQVRFKGAMELEKEREKLIEAHKQMEAERHEEAKAKARAKLLEVAQLRREGKSSQEILQLMQREKLEESIYKQDTYRKRERSELTAKRAKFMDLIDSLKATFESRDGERALKQQQEAANSDDPEHLSQLLNLDRTAPRAVPYAQPDKKPIKPVASAFDFPDEMEKSTSEADASVLKTADAVARKITEDRRRTAAGRGAAASVATDDEELATVRRQTLWQLVHQDSHEDPFLTVHQARLDAARTQDQILARTPPTRLALGSKKITKQGMGEDVVAGRERTILKKPESYTDSANFVPVRALYLDMDPTVEYGATSWGAYIRDPKTWEIDTRYQRRSGPPMLRGPRFYKIGAEREAKDPGNWPIHAAPKKAGGIRGPEPVRSE